MKKHFILYLMVALSAFIFQSCAPAKEPATSKEQTQEQVKQEPVEQVPQQTEKAAQTGESLFNAFCVACHRDGGNIINPKKTLQRDALKSNNINTPEDIIRIIRNPGKGMKKYDENTIPDKDARIIGEYILETFK